MLLWLTGQESMGLIHAGNLSDSPILIVRVSPGAGECTLSAKLLSCAPFICFSLHVVIIR